VPPAFYACVRVHSFDDRSMWAFAAHCRPYKTMAAAVDACEKHERIWNAVIELGAASGRRLDRLMVLKQRGKVGRGGDMLAMVPLWAAAQLDPVLMNMLQPKTRAKVEDDDCEDVRAEQPVAAPELVVEKPKAKPKAKPKTNPVPRGARGNKVKA
jgi:hypothetical protein